MVAVVAVEEPDTAAKMPHASTLVCASRPGRRDIQGASPENIWSASRVRNRISPIQMKSGSAVSAQSVLPPNTVVASSAPALVLVKNATATPPTTTMAIAIHRPPARSTSSKAARIRLVSVSAIALAFGLLELRRCPIGRDAAPQNRDEVVEERDCNQRDAQGHRPERKPLGDRDRPDRELAELPGLERRLAGGPGEPRADRGGGREAGDF